MGGPLLIGCMKSTFGTLLQFELDQRVIGFWKYVRIGINTYLKNWVENHSKIDNSVNIQNSKTPKSNFSKVWKENRDNMLERNHESNKHIITINYYNNTVGTLGYQIWAIFWSWDNLVKFRNIKKQFWVSKYDVSIHP